MSASFSPSRDEIITQDVIDAIADALHRATALSASAVKDVARRMRSPLPTVKNWLARRNGPSATELIRLMREFDEVNEAVMHLCGRTPAAITEEKAQRLARALAIIEGREAA